MREKASLLRLFAVFTAGEGIKSPLLNPRTWPLNSYVTPEGAEIGRAQAVQALAACREAHIDMNPVLLKPEENSRSQVILMGRPWKTLAAADYFKGEAGTLETGLRRHGQALPR